MSHHPQPAPGAPQSPASTDGARRDERDAAVAIVAALGSLQDVSTREDLLAWADLKLRPLIAYTSMACLLAEPHADGFIVRDVIASDDGAGSFDVAPTDASDGQRHREQRHAERDARIVEASCAVIDHWMRDGCALQVGMFATRAQEEEERVAPLLEYFKVDAVVVHGVKEAFSGSATFFIAGVAADAVDTPHALDVLTLIMPALHVARQKIHRAERSSGSQGPALGLTPREVKILTLVAAGQTDEEAAKSVGRSVHTVKNQMRHVVTKLGARNRTQAVFIAERHDLLSTDDDSPAEHPADAGPDVDLH